MAYYAPLIKNTKATYGTWKAEYDPGDHTKDNEDSVYCFTLYETGVDGPVAQSQYVHVSAPKPDATEYVTVSTTLTFRPKESSTTEPTTETITEPTSAPTTTDLPSTEGTNSNASPEPDSGLSRSAAAGIAVGATLGGLLVLGGVGWLAWKRFARGEKESNAPNGLQYQQQQQPYSLEPKAVLPGNPEAYPSEFARSLPGLHEAP
ncbi:hypothetical protein FOQG_18314 [Fusarium oxysporum f. sp. raphani 54005]|uniref:Mid2 domain-containing protein n=2 Tax=Fusarium oxysporum f. sp. raphani TaxID=96318 RepID=X0B5B4_FUSOX|nr:hypothetical protein FOQG_18314 [Fusarium oxysporum f. sp. raphani 54005]KAG7403082.1 hypothetical protein Forpi1262_v018821 [Fusarium oxysporum f. sp. raphani]